MRGYQVLTWERGGCESRLWGIQQVEIGLHSPYLLAWRRLDNYVTRLHRGLFNNNTSSICRLVDFNRLLLLK